MAAGKRSRPASPAELALSGGLINGTFGLIGIAMFAGAAFFDKIQPAALSVGFGFGVFGVVALLVSIVFGGRGATAPVSPGPSNPFNFQVLWGLLGIVLLVIAAGIFMFNPKHEEPLDKRLSQAEKDIAVLQARVNADTALEKEIANLIGRQSPQSAGKDGASQNSRRDQPSQ